MVSKQTEHCFVKKKTKILDFACHVKNLARSLCFAVLALQASLKAEQGNFYVLENKAAVVVSGSKNVYSRSREAKS